MNPETRACYLNAALSAAGMVWWLVLATLLYRFFPPLTFICVAFGVVSAWRIGTWLARAVWGPR